MNPQLRARAARLAGLGYPLYVNGKLYQEPVTISHVPAMSGFGAVDPSMGSLGEIVDYGITKGVLRKLSGLFGLGDDTTASSPPAAAPPAVPAPPAVVPEPPPPVPMFSDVSPTVKFAAVTLDLLSTAGLAYHGYKRNNSIAWSLVWALVGGAVPIIAWPVALAQGFNEPKRMTANKRSSCGCGGMKKNGRRRTRRRRRR